jgi:hypothetical protein
LTGTKTVPVNQSAFIRAVIHRARRSKSGGWAAVAADVSEPETLAVGAGSYENNQTEQRDELAPFHSITSSARPSSVAATARPSALAVFKLITSSNIVGCCTGRLAGCSPLSIRSTYPAACRNHDPASRCRPLAICQPALESKDHRREGEGEPRRPTPCE